jgi:hypothetical protein
MQITRNSLDTSPGPGDWFTYIDTVATPTEPSRLAAASVHFTPGARTAWHIHLSAPNRFMTHLAMQEADDSGSPVTWGEHVTDEEYGAAPGS